MNFKDSSLVLCLGMLIPIVLVGISIRNYFDNGQYVYMGISITIAIIMLLLCNWLYNKSRSKDDNGGIQVLAE
jgi:hypothetical protein